MAATVIGISSLCVLGLKTPVEAADQNWSETEYLNTAFHRTQTPLNLQKLSSELSYDQWIGYYYDNMSLKGNPVAKQVVDEKNGQLVRDLGNGSPAQNVPKDHFSARYVSKKQLKSGTYKINSAADDGIRIYVDGVLVLDNWSKTDMKNGESDVIVHIADTLNGSTDHFLEVEYYDDTKLSNLKLSIEPYSENIPSDKWLSKSYANKELKGSYVLDEHDSIALDWGKGSPLGMPSDNFSMNLSRYIEGSKDYYVQTYADDGVRVSIDGKKVIDRFTNADGKMDSAVFSAGSDKKILANVDYFEDSKWAYVFADVVPIGDWVAYYYNNTELKGSPVKTRTIDGDGKSLAFNYGYDAPMSGVNKDNYSASFSTAQRFEAGDYVISSIIDDGFRLYVDDKLVVDRWTANDSKKTQESITINDVKGSDMHKIRIEYKEHTKNSLLDFSIKPVDEVVQQDKWIGMVYPNTNLVNNSKALPILTTNQLLYDWGKSSPEGVPVDKFSARFVKNIKGSTEYYAQTYADDGVRLKLGDKTVINRWSNADGKTDRAIVTGMDKGNLLAQVDYYDNTKWAYVLADVVPLGDWVSYYYNNTDLSGTPVHSQVINGDGRSLSFDYGYNSPAKRVNKDNYSASFATAQHIKAGEYLINTTIDDGFRLYIDEKLVIDKWGKNDSAESVNAIKINDLKSSDLHKIRIEYKEHTKNSKLDFKMIPLTDGISTDKWLNVFYPNKELNNSGLLSPVSKTNNVAFNWGTSNPISGIPADNFSVRSLKQIAGGTDYFLSTFADDGVRVSVDGKNIIDEWHASDGAIVEALVPTLSSGSHVVESQYYEGSKNAVNFVDAVKLGDWKAYYFNNKNLSGYPVAAKTISNSGNGIQQDYGRNSPAAGVSADGFSASYGTYKKLQAGKYTVRAKADDGIKVYIDDKLVIDKWNNSNYEEKAVTFDVSDLQQAPAGQKDIHHVRVEYYDHVKDAKFDLDIEPYDSLTDSNGTWVAEYFNNPNLTGNAIIVGGKNSLNQIKELNFDWGKGSPIEGIPVDNFSARYERKLNLSSEKNYYLNVRSDDGYRVYLNGERIVNKWSSGTYEDTQILTIPKGNNTVTVEYRDTGNWAYIDVDLSELVQAKFYEKSNFNYTFSSFVDKQTANSSTSQTDASGSWGPATKSQVSYYANPNNFNNKDSQYYFQFMKLSGSANLDVDEINQKVLSGKGILAGKAQAFIDAGKKYNINEVYLLAHALHETGNGTSPLAKGQKINGVTVYNMYGIGAYDGTALESGTKEAYRQGWTTPEKAIEGGAKWISDNYVSRGQDTLYEMKWNPNAPATHQYATDIGWAVKQTSKIQSVYKLISNYIISFDEPVYLQQPGESELDNGGNTDTGTGAGVTAYPENVIGYPTTSLNFRSGPSTSYGTIGSLNTNSKLEILGQNSNGWLQVKADGKTGWVSGSYVTIKNLLQVDLDSGALNVRSGASTSSSSVGALSNGEYVAAVLDSNENRVMENGFSKIYYNNGTAYVYSTYVNVK